MMKQYIKHILMLVLIGWVMVGCNKTGDVRYGTVINVFGTNTTGEELSVTIDTMQYRSFNSPYADLYIQPNSNIIFTYALSYTPDDNPVLRVTGHDSGKVYLEQPLKKSVLSQSYGFLWVDGKNHYNPPAPSSETNKIGFFNMFYDFPVDIYLRTYQQKYNEYTGQHEFVYDESKKLVGKLPRNTWVYVDYIPEGNYVPKHANLEIIVCEAGKQEQLIKNDTKMGFPRGEERGKVQSYFIFKTQYDSPGIEVIEKEL